MTKSTRYSLLNAEDTTARSGLWNSPSTVKVKLCLAICWEVGGALDPPLQPEGWNKTVELEWKLGRSDELTHGWRVEAEASAGLVMTFAGL